MPMTLFADADALLRCEKSYRVGRGPVPWRGLIVLLLVGGWTYGAAMGAYGGRPLQMLYSASKVPLLLVASTLVVLPNFFVVNTLLGLRDDLGAALRAVLAAQATVAVALAAMAPLALFIYASTNDYDSVTVGNGVIFAMATLSGQVTLNRHYRPLVARDPAHAIAKRMWLVLYVFVAIQLAWVLRPFIGALEMPTAFLRDDAWGNAYVAIIRKVTRFFIG